MLTNNSLKSNPHLLNPLNVDVEDKVIQIEQCILMP